MAAGNTAFSANLQALRKKKGVTQEQLALFLGVSPQAVSKWENGSYPEGDLLPRISEFFGVSISYLYGQEKEKSSIEQEVFDALYGIMEKHARDGKDGSCHPEYFDKMLDIIWAFQIVCWKNNRHYYHRGIPENDTRTASLVTDGAGFGFFNLNLDRQFFTLVREPEEGFARHIKITEELREFFEFLGKPGALEIVFYLLTLKWGEYVTASTIAENTGLGIEKTNELLQTASKCLKDPNSHFLCIDIIGSDGVENAYGVNLSSICLFISLIMNADVLIHPPVGYQMQVSKRGRSWLDRKDVEKMLGELRKNGKV